ncbi:MAG: 3'(2'),5'-bisphosphate nucleotidase CysQ [Stenotrophobium sp.]
MNLKNLMEEVLPIAVAAGDAIMRVYESDFAVTHKDDDSPLTQADLAAHHIIIKALSALTPELPCLSEEAADIGYDLRRAWTRYWLIDPLDGTREFVKRNGEFTVNIALIDGSEAVLGVVYAPVTGVAYAAARGCGAFRRERDGSQRPIRVCSAASATVRVLASRSHGDAVLDSLLTRLGPMQRISVGSALKFGLLAEGQADLYVRRGRTSEWDTAAGHAVVSEAGGTVVDFSGQPLRYNVRDTLINPSFIAFGDTSRDWVGLLTNPADT